MYSLAPNLDFAGPIQFGPSLTAQQPDSSLPNNEDDESRTRVLLVDDHALVRAGLRALIEMHDRFEVVAEAGNGEQALHAIESLRPDVVLLDITMPGMNGFEVLTEIKRHFGDVRVIVLTMHDARECADQVLHSGAVGFIPKSAAAAEVTDAIETVMRGNIYISAQTAQAALVVSPDDGLDKQLLRRLTPRQREILICIANGQNTKQIARTLGISVKTVDSHRAQLTERLNIRDVAGLVRFAIRTGLVRIGLAIVQVLVSGLANSAIYLS